MWSNQLIGSLLMGATTTGIPRVHGCSQGLFCWVVQNGDGRFLRTETRKQNDELLSELGIEPNVGQALSDRHGFVGVGLKGDANA